MSARTGDLAPAVRAAVAAAGAWRLIGLLLARPRAGWHDEVQALAGEVADPDVREAAALSRAAGEGSYHALLGAGGAAPARAAAYCGWADPGRLLADLEARYQAFGFSPRTEEPVDHVAVEADFMAFLCLKEAWAITCGERDAAGVTRAARTRFAEEHLAPLVRSLAARLGAEAPRHLVAAAAAAVSRLPAVALPDPRAPTTLWDPLAAGCPAAPVDEDG